DRRPAQVADRLVGGVVDLLRLLLLVRLLLLDVAVGLGFLGLLLLRLRLVLLLALAGRRLRRGLFLARGLLDFLHLIDLIHVVLGDEDGLALGAAHLLAGCDWGLGTHRGGAFRAGEFREAHGR